MSWSVMSIHTILEIAFYFLWRSYDG